MKPKVSSVAFSLAPDPFTLLKGKEAMSNSTKVEDIRYVPFTKVKHYADIAWDRNLNVRKEYGTPEEGRKTRDMLSTRLGWDCQYPAIAEAVSDEELAAHLLRREEVHGLLKKLCNDNALSEDELKLRDKDVVIPRGSSTYKVKGREWAEARLAVFEFIYCNARGDFKAPKVTGATGNRRGTQLVDAAAVQLVNARLDEGDPKLQPNSDVICTHIAVIVPETPNKRFPDVAVRMQAQIRENTTKTAGFKPMSAEEDLQAVLHLVENFGKGQTDIRNSGYGSVFGLRLYFACIIDIWARLKASDHSLEKPERKAWKVIRFVERLVAPKFTDPEGKHVNPDSLDFKGFTQKVFQGDEKQGYLPMGLMTETDAKFEKENRRRVGLKDPKPEMKRPTPESITDWISKVTIEGGPKSKPALKRETVQSLASKNPNPFTRQAMLAVDKADETFLSASNAKSLVCQFVFGTSDEVYEPMAVACGLLDDLDDDVQVACLQQLIEAATAAIGAAETEVSSAAGEEEVVSAS